MVSTQIALVTFKGRSLFGYPGSNPSVPILTEKRIKTWLHSLVWKNPGLSNQSHGIVSRWSRLARNLTAKRISNSSLSKARYTSDNPVTKNRVDLSGDAGDVGINPHLLLCDGVAHTIT